MVVACTHELIATGHDEKSKTRGNVIQALVRNPGEPSPQAKDLFISALNDPQSNIRGLGALGLIRQSTGGDKSNIPIVVHALSNTTEESFRAAMVQGITESGVKDATLFAAVSPLLYDKQPSVQTAAMSAVVSTSPDKGQAISALQNLAGSSFGLESVRQSASALAGRLATD